GVNSAADSTPTPSVRAVADRPQFANPWSLIIATDLWSSSRHCYPSASPSPGRHPLPPPPAPTSIQPVPSASPLPESPPGRSSDLAIPPSPPPRAPPLAPAHKSLRGQPAAPAGAPPDHPGSDRAPVPAELPNPAASATAKGSCHPHSAPATST